MRLPWFNRKRKIRKALIKRKTTEVDIRGDLMLEGSGRVAVTTPFEPLNHLLTVFFFHGLFDCTLHASGDLKHHIIEDIGIALGKAFHQALGDKAGINRYGFFSATMDKVAVEVNIDISGRPSLHQEIANIEKDAMISFLERAAFDDTNFTFHHAKEFLESFLQHSGISMVYIIKSGEGDLHHILEALFKAFGKALDQAIQLDPRRKGIPSTKGIID